MRRAFLHSGGTPVLYRRPRAQIYGALKSDDDDSDDDSDSCEGKNMKSYILSFRARTHAIQIFIATQREKVVEVV